MSIQCVVHLAGFELYFDYLSTLGTAHEKSDYLLSSSTVQETDCIVDVGTDDEAFFPSVGTVLDGNDVAGLQRDGSKSVVRDIAAESETCFSRGFLRRTW